MERSGLRKSQRLHAGMHATTICIRKDNVSTLYGFMVVDNLTCHMSIYTVPHLPGISQRLSTCGLCCENFGFLTVSWTQRGMPPNLELSEQLTWGRGFELATLTFGVVCSSETSVSSMSSQVMSSTGSHSLWSWTDRRLILCDFEILCDVHYYMQRGMR